MKQPREILAAGVLGAGLVASAPAVAQVEWDVSIPWGPGEFHTVNAGNFAAAVEEATGGEVVMTIHAGGALGIRAHESLRAVEDGAVPMAEFAAFQNVGDVPILGIESIPFLIRDYDDLRVMHDLVRPLWETELERRNQKILYVVPWPSQNFFTSQPIETAEDLEGVRMRTYDANTATMVDRLGMIPQQMNNVDIVPALATGRLDAVMTSGTTAVAQQYWEFLDYVYNTNHLWASNIMAVNLDVWNELSPEHQEAIEALARDMEPEFWTVSEGEHETRMAELTTNGMTVAPVSDALQTIMREATADMTGEVVERVGGESGAIIEAFSANRAP